MVILANFSGSCCAKIISGEQFNDCMAYITIASLCQLEFLKEAGLTGQRCKEDLPTRLRFYRRCVSACEPSLRLRQLKERRRNLNPRPDEPGSKRAIWLLSQLSEWCWNEQRGKACCWALIQCGESQCLTESLPLWTTWQSTAFSLSLPRSLSLLYLFVSFSPSPAFGKLAENPHILPSTPTKTELKILKSKVQNDRRGAILHVKIWLKNFAVFNPLVLILCICLRDARKRKLVFYFLNLKTCVWLPLRDPRLCFMGSLISTLSGWRDIFSPPHTWNTREAYINERLKRTQGSLAAILKHL